MSENCKKGRHNFLNPKVTSFKCLVLSNKPKDIQFTMK